MRSEDPTTASRPVPPRLSTDRQAAASASATVTAGGRRRTGPRSVRGEGHGGSSWPSHGVLQGSAASGGVAGRLSGNRCWSRLAEQSPDLVLLGGQGACRIAWPLVDEGADRRGDFLDVDALAAVRGDELVVVAVTECGHRAQLEPLVAAAVTGPLLDGGAIGRRDVRDVQALAADVVDDGVGVGRAGDGVEVEELLLVASAGVAFVLSGVPLVVAEPAPVQDVWVGCRSRVRRWWRRRRRPRRPRGVGGRGRAADSCWRSRCRRGRVVPDRSGRRSSRRNRRFRTGRGNGR